MLLLQFIVWDQRVVFHRGMFVCLSLLWFMWPERQTFPRNYLLLYYLVRSAFTSTICRNQIPGI